MRVPLHHPALPLSLRRSVAESGRVALRWAAAETSSETLRQTIGPGAAGEPRPAAAVPVTAAVAGSISVDRAALGVGDTPADARISGAEPLAAVSVSAIAVGATAAVTDSALGRVLGDGNANAVAIRGVIEIAPASAVAAREGRRAVTIEVDSTLDAAIRRPAAWIAELPGARPDASADVASLPRLAGLADDSICAAPRIGQALNASAVWIGAGQITLVPIRVAAAIDADPAPAARRAGTLRASGAAVAARVLILTIERHAFVVDTAAAVASRPAIVGDGPADTVVAAGKAFRATSRRVAIEEHLVARLNELAGEGNHSRHYKQANQIQRSASAA